jgi:hypothetical protein
MIDNLCRHPNQTTRSAQAANRRFEEIVIEQLIRPRPTPVFYRNETGVVTMRWQFLIYYEHQLAAGMPIGPHVFGLR